MSFSKPTGTVILGYMGSGKSYALGVLIENTLIQVPNITQNERPMAVVAFNYRQNSGARFEYAGDGNGESRAADRRWQRAAGTDGNLFDHPLVDRLADAAGDGVASVWAWRIERRESRGTIAGEHGGICLGGRRLSGGDGTAGVAAV